MKLIWHIFKKDFGGQYLTFLLWILCGTYVGVMTRQGGHSAVVQDWLLMVAGISFYAFFFILVVEAVQEDSLIDSTAFWQTRPISSGRLLAAKGIFILGMLVVKLLASLAIWLFLPNPEHKAFGDWDIWLAMLSFALLSGGLAACTKNLGKCFLGLVICLIVFLVASALADQWFRPIALSHMHQTAADIIAQHNSTWPFRHSPGQLTVPTRISSSVVVQIIISVAGMAAMLTQYFTRRTAVTMSLLFIAVLCAAAGSTYWKLNAIWAVTPPASSGVKLDAQVKNILTGAAKFYADAQSFEADIDSVTYFKPATRNRDIDSPFHVAFQRPDLFSIIGNGSVVGGTMVSNGKTLIVYEPASKKYTSTDAPGDLSEILSPRHLIHVDGSLLPLGYEDFLQKDPIMNFEDGLLESEYVGSERITDLSAQHVRLTYKNLVADYWIADGPQPLLLQAQFTHDLPEAMKSMSDAQKFPAGTGSIGMVQISTYTDWRINQPVAAAAFEFQSPPETKPGTESFTRTLHPLVGKMARDFQLNDLDGKPVKLSDLRGKAVVLDFWTTSCSASLPVVTAAISSRKTQGVVFYAINLMESADIIRAFQKEKGLDFPVLLDSAGEVDKHYFAKHYLHKGTPQLVLIDKDGKVEAVKVGYAPGFKNELSQQLDDMIAGKSLLPDAEHSMPDKGP